MDKLDKDIQKIKLARMKPEEKYIYNIFLNLKKIISEQNKFRILYKFEGNIIFEYEINTKKFYCFIEIWDVLLKKYNLTQNDIINLFIKMGKNILKIDINNVSWTITRRRLFWKYIK